MARRTAEHPVFAQRLAFARERAGKHEPQLKTAKQLADALGVPPAFFYTEDELLAQLLLQWNDLSVSKKKALLKSLEKAPRGKTPKKTPDR